MKHKVFDQSSILAEIVSRATHYTQLALRCESVFSIVVLLLFYHVQFVHLGLFLLFLAVSILNLLLSSDRGQNLLKTNFPIKDISHLLFELVCIQTLVIGILLFFIMMPICFLPLVLAMTYFSSYMTRLAVDYLFVYSLITPTLSYIAGFWSPAMLVRFANHYLSFFIRTMSELEYVPSTNILCIFFLVSVPWIMILFLVRAIILRAAEHNEKNVQFQMENQRMMQEDSLTGLYNRNAYANCMINGLEHTHIGVMFFDVDGLKQVNDNSGHEAGDLLLKMCADSIHSILDEHTVGFRIGGDEFVVLCECDCEEVLDQKKKVWLHALNKVNIECVQEQTGFECRMSLGMSFGNSEHLKELVVEADQKMYKNKAGNKRMPALVMDKP